MLNLTKTSSDHETRFKYLMGFLVLLGNTSCSDFLEEDNRAGSPNKPNTSQNQSTLLLPATAISEDGTEGSSLWVE
jgi:hypothetical protein